jgi:hypothetical protein
VNAGEVKVTDIGKKWEVSVRYCFANEGNTTAPRTVTFGQFLTERDASFLFNDRTEVFQYDGVLLC